MTTHTIDRYTGSWQPAIYPKEPVAEGDTVLIAYEPDDREWHDFSRHIAKEGLEATFRSTRKSDWVDVYELTKVQSKG